MRKTPVIVVGIVVALATGAAIYFGVENQGVRHQLAAVTAERDTALHRLKETTASLRAETSRAKAADDDNERLLKIVAATKATRAAPVPTKTPAPVAGVTTTPPAGWGKNGSKAGSYVVGVDANESLYGQPSSYVASTEASVEGFGGMMQTTPPGDMAGKRVRLTGWMKTEDANEGGGHLWLRVDGQNPRMAQFDNMNGRAPTGTTGWTQYSVVLDVPTDTRALAYGMFLQGAGKMWVNSPKLEVVGDDVPSTNMIKPTPVASQE